MYVALANPHGVAMIAALLVAGLAVHMIWPIFFVMYADRTPPALKGTGMGLFFAMGYLVGATSPVAMGYMGTVWSPAVANYLVPITAVLAAVSILAVAKCGKASST
jgi:MFS family permease